MDTHSQTPPSTSGIADPSSPHISDSAPAFIASTSSLAPSSTTTILAVLLAIAVSLALVLALRDVSDSVDSSFGIYQRFGGRTYNTMPGPGYGQGSIQLRATQPTPILDVSSFLGRQVDSIEADMGPLPLAYPDIPTMNMRVRYFGPLYLQFNHDTGHLVYEIIVNSTNKNTTETTLLALAHLDRRDTRYILEDATPCHDTAYVAVSVYIRGVDRDEL